MGRIYLGNIKGPKGDKGEAASSANIGVATQRENGLMSATDKVRLDTIWEERVKYIPRHFTANNRLERLK